MFVREIKWLHALVYKRLMSCSSSRIPRIPQGREFLVLPSICKLKLRTKPAVVKVGKVKGKKVVKAKPPPVRKIVKAYITRAFKDKVGC